MKKSEVEVTERSVFVRSASSIRQLSDKLDALGVEARGIQRIQPYERGTANQFWHVAGLWLSAAGGLSSMSSYFLGPIVFQLTLNQCLVSGLISMWIGCGVAAYCSIMGPQSGCRQIVTARYLFGWWFVKFIALAAIVGGMGWSIVNCVVGGQMLASVSDGKVPLWVGIIIVSVVSLLVSIFGIKQVLKVETLFAVPVLTSFLLLYISASDKFKYLYEFSNSDIDSLTVKGCWLSFFSLCYSITSTWGSVTADYYILFPEDTPQIQVFLLTFFGTAVPTTFVGVLGLLLASCSLSYEPWQAAYEEYGMGGLMNAGFSRWNGFGKFLVVVLVLSLISDNIVNTYSAAFSIQLSSVMLAKVPRWIWAIGCTIFYLVCALVGRNSFSTILGNFLPMIGYWISMYFILLLEENVIFRNWFHHLYKLEFPNDIEVKPHHKLRRLPRHIHRYNWDEWDNSEVITRGLAASAAFCIGVAGVVLGMCQTYYVGPLAAKIGEYGGDLGMWLGIGFAGVSYPLLRYWELKKFGR
ncbi:Tpn1 [Kluyveromyces lactis]|nr:Tpn1 [Kluyveromyces lactis]